MEKVRSVKALGNFNLTNDETNLLLVYRGMIIPKYNLLLSDCSIVIMFTCMTAGVDNTTLALSSISHNMADRLSHPVCNPRLCMLFMDQFDYRCCTYYFIKQVSDVVTAYYIDEDNDINICMNLCTNTR